MTGSVNICQSKVENLSKIIASLSAKCQAAVKKSSHKGGKGHYGHSHSGSQSSSHGSHGFSYTQNGGLFAILKTIFGSSFGEGFKSCEV